MAERCIVKGKEGFEAKEYIDSYSVPVDCVLTEYNNSKFNTYELTNGIKIKFLGYKYYIDKPICEFSFEDRMFKKIEKEDFNLQTVISYINKYNNYVEREIENLVELAEQKTKPQLQVEIEELNAKIERLKSKIDIYTQIDIQYEKIKEMLSKLEE